MNPTAKRLWLEALRSGRFSQTEGTLADDDGYCCLGVLCEVAINAGVDVERHFFGAAADRGAYDGSDRGAYNGSVGVLPITVRDWAGLDSTDPDLLVGDLGPALAGRVVALDLDAADGLDSVSLAQMNDGGASFALIADVIERAL